MFNPIKAAGDAAKSVGDVAKKAASTAADVARDPGQAFGSAVQHAKETVADVAKSPAKALDGVQTALDVAGFVPGVGIVADLANAGISAARGDFAGAALNAAAAIPIAGDALKGGKMAAKGVDAATTAARAADRAGDAAKVAGKSTDAAKGADEAAAAAKKAAAEAAQKRVDELATQGHGPQRHGPDITPEQLDKRAREKLDPVTGTRLDAYKKNADGTPARHSCQDHATKFTSNESMVKAEGFARSTDEFKAGVEAGAPSIKVKTRMEDVFGADYKDAAAGRSRTTPWPDTATPTQPTDFTDGTVSAFYNRNASGQYDLVTIYPEPK